MKTLLTEQNGTFNPTIALGPKEPVKHDLLTQAGKLFAMGYEDAGHILLEQFSPWDDISQICKNVLNSSQFTENLYLKSAEGENKQINLFDIILRAVPSVNITTGIALETLVKHYAEHHTGEVSLVNIGIGRGIFEAHLVEALSKLPEPPATVNIIGIDIDQQSVNEAEAHIKAAMLEHMPDARFNYCGIVEFAENLNEETAHKINSFAKGCLTVVSAFSLHHIQENEDRTEVLRQIKAWNAELVVLVEPDVDHFTPDFTARLKNCRRHFGKIFEVIDQLLSCEEEKAAIKNLFFGREIENILKLDNGVRFEKHETSEAWLSRIQDAGLLPVRSEVSLPDHSHIEYNVLSKGRIQTLCDDVPMVSVLVSK